jgi:hypothetical protein
MASIDSSARMVSTAADPVARDGGLRRVSVASALGRLLASWRDVWRGASWEPGDDWLTRVADPAERQEPR